MRIAYHAYRVSCVTLGKMKGHEKKCNSKFILYIYNIKIEIQNKNVKCKIRMLRMIRDTRYAIMALRKSAF